jgi:hypothetical protein
MKHTVWCSVAPLQQIEAGQDPAVDAGTGHWKRQSEAAATAGQLRCILPADYEVLQGHLQTTHLCYCTTLPQNKSSTSHLQLLYTLVTHEPIRSWLMQLLPKLDGLLGKISQFDPISGSPQMAPSGLAGPKLPESLLDAINGIIAQVLVLSSVS